MIADSDVFGLGRDHAERPQLAALSQADAPAGSIDNGVLPDCRPFPQVDLRRKLDMGFGMDQTSVA
jgi:hypothetical protein